jgi:hypothetical protein
MHGREARAYQESSPLAIRSNPLPQSPLNVSILLYEFFIPNELVDCCRCIREHASAADRLRHSGLPLSGNRRPSGIDGSSRGWTLHLFLLHFPPHSGQLQSPQLPCQPPEDAVHAWPAYRLRKRDLLASCLDMSYFGFVSTVSCGVPVLAVFQYHDEPSWIQRSMM